MAIRHKASKAALIQAGVCAAVLVNALSIKAYAGAQGPDHKRVQVAAYYFPNWHTETQPSPSAGEWDALKNAKPRFAGHQQPITPMWGYQDEADPSVMAQKIDAAAEHGVDAFLFDWYWRNGEKDKGPMLERALDAGYLKAPNRDRVKFALMWANHDLGEDSPGAIGRPVFDAITDHIVRDYFTSSSYWLVDGRCYFSIYQLKTFINGLGGVEQAKMALDSLRAKTVAAGRKGLYLNVMDWELPDDPKSVLKTLGVDSITSYVWVHTVKLKDFPKTDYAWMAGQYFKQWDAQQNAYGVPYFPNVTSGWDPTPRVPASTPYDGKKYPNTPILSGNSPQEFKKALEEARQRALGLPEGQQVVTIYAWNEWTEGGFLEPDAKTRLASLDAIKEVFRVSAH